MAQVFRRRAAMIHNLVTGLDIEANATLVDADDREHFGANPLKHSLWMGTVANGNFLRAHE